MYDFINNSVIGGLCVCSNPYLSNDNNKSTIAYQDVSSLYPAIMRKKMPLKNYKFIDLKQFLALISKTSIYYDNLSDYQKRFQRKNINHQGN